MYKIEPHLHTNHVSKCAWLPADALAGLYHAAGYHAVAVTDHYNMDTWDYLGIDPKDPADVMPRFLDGFHRMQEAAARFGLTVYLGAELRFYENDNDYLLYGFDPALLAHPHEIMSMGAVAFSDLIRGSDAVLIQAHPFRAGCIPLAPCFLDGIEIYNASPRTAGSDCHRTEDVGRSGICSAKLPADSAAFAAMLRAGDFSCMLPDA